MKKLTVPVLNLLLAVGVVFILAGLFLLTQFVTKIEIPFPIYPALTMITGAVLFYLSLVIFKRSLLCFTGIYTFFVGILYMLFSTVLSEYDEARFWPIAILMCSLSLTLTSLIKYRKLKSVYIFPSCLLAGLGVLYLLFSFSIIKISFINFISQWWPLFFILLGGFLVFVFLYQQTPDNHFPYTDDVTIVDSDFSGDSAE